MPNVQDINRFLFLEHDKKKAVCTAIAGAEEQFAYRLIE